MNPLSTGALGAIYSMDLRVEEGESSAEPYDAIYVLYPGLAGFNGFANSFSLTILYFC